MAAAVEGIGLGAYRFEGARQAAPSRPARTGPGGGAGNRRNGATTAAVAAAVRRGQVAVDATWRARDWVNRPPRDLTPTELARVADRRRRRHGATVEVWDRDRIERGAARGPAGGRRRGVRAAVPPAPVLPSRADPKASVALVGKGITFDSGGLSLEAAGRDDDDEERHGRRRGGDRRHHRRRPNCGLPVRVVGWVAATENMPSGTAIHPGDVLVARNGTSIEVLNTDAEGRLVLADALCLAAEEEPDAIVDIATLTGGQRVALGDGVAAVMGTDEALVRRVIAAGAAAGEPAWELPLVGGLPQAAGLGGGRPAQRRRQAGRLRRSWPPCSCRSSPAAGRGPTSISPPRAGRTATTAGSPRGEPGGGPEP